MKKIGMKRILALVLVFLMTTAATSTVFARGFGGGRMAQGQGCRRIAGQCRFDSEFCRYEDAEYCLCFDEDGNLIIPRERLGRGRGLGVCRRLQ